MAIIAAVDRSERANDVIREAELIAKAFEEPVHVVHVLSSSDFVELGRTKAEAGDSVNMDEVKNMASKIAADAASELDVTTEIVGLTGDPGDRVVDYAENIGAKYIIIAGRRRSPTGKMIFGSVSQDILLNADCPVVSKIS